MDFADWIVALKREFTTQSDMTLDESSRMVDGCGLECWREMYDEEMTPAEAARTEISYWDDESEGEALTSC